VAIDRKVLAKAVSTGTTKKTTAVKTAKTSFFIWKRPLAKIMKMVVPARKKTGIPIRRELSLLSIDRKMPGDKEFIFLFSIFS